MGLEYFVLGLTGDVYIAVCLLQSGWGFALLQTVTAEQVMNFFLPCGEIKFVRMAGDETQPTR